jgi:predicted RecA/RadA family phage recombinase
MAIMDKYLEFADAEAMSTAAVASASTALSGVIELSKRANPNSGKGSPVYIHIRPSTTFTSGGSATVAFNLEHAATNSPASFSAVAALIPATPVSTFTTNYHFVTALPAVTLKRFIRIKYTVGTTRLTAGAVDAWLDITGG